MNGYRLDLVVKFLEVHKDVTKNQSKTLATLTSHVGARVDVLGYPNIWRLP